MDTELFKPEEVGSQEQPDIFLISGGNSGMTKEVCGRFFGFWRGDWNDEGKGLILCGGCASLIHSTGLLEG